MKKDKPRARPSTRLLLACLCLPLALAAREAQAWPAPLMESLARDARRLLPATLNRLIGEREERIFEEARRFPPQLAQALARDLQTGSLSGGSLAGIDEHMGAFSRLFRERRVSDALVLLGASFRVPADLADPVLSAGPAGYPPGVAREYYAFVESNLAKIPVVLEDRAALAIEPTQLPAYWQAVLDRSRAQSALIGRELFRQGRLVDHRTLDFRSPAFGVGSLSYSRAVNAIAVTWLALWRQANGDTTRMPVPVEVRSEVKE